MKLNLQFHCMTRLKIHYDFQRDRNLNENKYAVNVDDEFIDFHSCEMKIIDFDDISAPQTAVECAGIQYSAHFTHNLSLCIKAFECQILRSHRNVLIQCSLWYFHFFNITRSPFLLNGSSKIASKIWCLFVLLWWDDGKRGCKVNLNLCVFTALVKVLNFFFFLLLLFERNAIRINFQSSQIVSVVKLTRKRILKFHCWRLRFNWSWWHGNVDKSRGSAIYTMICDFYKE